MKHRTYVATGNSDYTLAVEWYSGFKSESVSVIMSEYQGKKKFINTGGWKEIIASSVKLADLKALIKMIEENGVTPTNTPVVNKPMSTNLRQAYKDYIALLGKDLDSHASLSIIHGCQTPPEMVEEGNRLRALINKLEAEEK